MNRKPAYANFCPAMNRRMPPQIELLPDGRYRRRETPVATRILRWALVIALVAGSLAVGAFFLWFALMLLPVAIIAGVVAWLAFRYRLWRSTRQPRW